MVNAKEKIKSSDLRIGNWIERLGVFEKVYSLSQEWFRVESDSHKAYSYDNINGIVITPEILEKAGFVPIGHFTVMGNMTYNLGRNRYLSIGCIGTPNETLYVCEKEDIVCVHNFDYDGKLYLHTLQNLVHILTGTELPIKFD